MDRSIAHIDFPYFTGGVRFINDPREGIAKSHRQLHHLVLNLYYWNKLKPAHKFYILAHEEGHILFNTRDEMKADDHASDKYLAAGGSLTESIKALSDHLDRNNPVHIARAWLQYERALKYDNQHNHNKKAFRAQYDTEEIVKQKLKHNEYGNFNAGI